MLDDVKRVEIAEALDDLAAPDTWSADVWQRCYRLVGPNAKQNDLSRSSCADGDIYLFLAPLSC